MSARRTSWVARTAIFGTAGALLGLLALTVVTVRTDGSGGVTGTVKVAGVRDSGNVIVFLDGGGPVAAPARHAVMDQKNLAFEPHVLPVAAGASVDFPNSDQVRHNVYSPATSVKRFNLGTYPAGTIKTERFDQPGVVPLLCNVHSEMSGFILVVNTPYYTTTDKYGRFTLKDVAPGKYVLRTWHEKIKSAEQPIVVAAGTPLTVQVEMSGRK